MSRDQVADSMRAGQVPEEFAEESTEQALASGRSGVDRDEFTRVTEFSSSHRRARNRTMAKTKKTTSQELRIPASQQTQFGPSSPL